MVAVSSGGADHGDLGGNAAEGDVGVGGGDGHFSDLADGEAVGHEIEGIGADAVVLNIDTVEGDGSVRRAKAIDDGDEEFVGGDAGLEGEEVGDLTVANGEVFDLLLGGGGGDFEGGALDGGGGDGEGDGGEVGFAGGVDFDSSLEGF